MTRLSRLLTTPRGLWGAVMAMGFLGAVCRYLLTLALPDDGGISVSTLSVNMVGCFALALVNEWLGRRTHLPSGFVKALGVGFVGSFTTLSAVQIGTFSALLRQDYGLACLEMGLTVVLSIVAVATGHLVCGVLARHRVERLRSARRCRRGGASR